MKLKQGDWCFKEYELHQVKSIDGDIVKLSDGYTTSTTSGYYIYDRCFPLTLGIKIISGEYKHHYRKLKEITYVNINWPDVCRKLESLWINDCIKHENGVDITYNELHNFVNDIIDKCERIKNEHVNGISIIR